jgi:hypothetical protein
MVDLKTYSELHPSDQKASSDRREEQIDGVGAEAMKRDSPPDSNFVFLVPVKIKAYNLKQKKWVDLRVDRLSEVVWNKEAFKSLVLDNKTKNLIQALISNQLEAENSTDLISGKGNGLILLLHGGPGTGKTLTAESVAEIAEKPLYPVTCGDIGTEPEKVEIYLESVLNLGKLGGVSFSLTKPMYSSSSEAWRIFSGMRWSPCFCVSWNITMGSSFLRATGSVPSMRHSNQGSNWRCIMPISAHIKERKSGGISSRD